jgi:DNA-binding HxlR family transcriptional regulator
MSPSPTPACVLDADCPSRHFLSRLADKWSVLVIYALEEGPQRNGELRRMIGGISQKMLTQTLRNLERDGLVARKVHAVVPPRVDYALTPLGRSLGGPLAVFCEWAERHLPQMMAARRRYAPKREEPERVGV